MAKRILVVGGVAAGSSCATRARRLDESAEIVVFERGPHVSFANCGLPYHVGSVIERESDLVLVTPDRFRERHAIDVRVEHEVVAIDRAGRAVEVLDRRTGVRSRESYDALVLATGSEPIRPPVSGLDLPGVFTLRTVPETRRVREWIAERQARRAVVLGAGFVGLEVAENLMERGLEVHLVDLAHQVLPPLDPEMASMVADAAEERGVVLHLGHGLAGVEAVDTGLRVALDGSSPVDADLVILGLGVRPSTALARAAGLHLGPTGGVWVDDRMATSDPAIWAVGDVAEAKCAVTGEPRLLPLAGPANREGRLAADAICGREVHFRGVQGTAVCGAFGVVAACTGRSARELTRMGRPHESLWLHPDDHASYFPGATPIHLKVIYDPDGGRVLGAQAVGRAGVEKRIDVIAMAMQLRATVYDLEQAELCYAPQFGAAKDPVNIAGMIGANQLRGDLPVVSWHQARDAGALLVDVREPREFARGHVEGAVNIPLGQLRERVGELPTDRVLWLYCLSGKRSYDAARALIQLGYDARTVAGGFDSLRQLERARAR